MSHHTLGRSGLVVSPLALGTMTFGAARWGADQAASRDIFNLYVDGGGNFVDTADVYAAGQSEEWLGQFIAERRLRDHMVVATKSGFATGTGIAGGNGAKHIHASVDASLKRLGMDHIDLYWLHVWDQVTPPEEVLETMSGLIRAGKIRYWGLSNTPPWVVAQLATMAQLRAQPAPIALQYFYSLANREVEADLLPMAARFGMALQPWSPLAFGLLAGKYNAADAGPRAAGLPRDAATAGVSRPADDKRLDGANPFGDSLFTERNWQIVETLRSVAHDMDQTSARVALAWVLGRPGVVAPLLGVSRIAQLDDNKAALVLRLPDHHRAALDAISAPEPRMLDMMFTPALRQHGIFGGTRVRGWDEAA